MRGAPNWKVNTDPVDGVWKQQLLVWVASVIGARTLVETGTCEGSTPAAVHTHFDQILTCELHDGLFATSSERLKDIPNVRLYHDSSPAFLLRLFEQLELLNEPTVFWLDAHSSGPHTANDGDPLPKELSIITRYLPKAVIVVDDQPDAELRSAVEFGVDFMGWSREYRTGEVLIYRPELYNIPPFEDSL